MNDETTPPDDSETTKSVDRKSSAPPSRIGNYRLLRKLGEGGMGEVWEAEQEKPFRRKVALKLIKWGMDTERVIARFEAERQALALMNHANVAKVFDAGATERGRPYFVMELVKGEPITKHCDRQRLTTKERLGLFMQVCEGVQHAHQKGIIHRDIKPSNILVQVEGEKRAPKIIDFGVAKAIEQRLTERTVFTELGQLIGTPEYMSPEQAEMTVEDIDTRTDVYSLGVLLYELLVGSLPFDPRDLRRAGFDEIRRRIREEEPSKPSSKLATLGDDSTESAANRGTNPNSLARQLRGDLDWITMKALEKDRTRRYGSPSEFGADVERYLKLEPVLAGPPGIVYRTRKFARRHRVGVMVGAFAVGIFLVAATLGILQRRLEAGRDLQRIRWVLEQVISTGAKPTDLEPTWDRLERRLHAEVRGDSQGSLAGLALEAAARASAEVIPFGLVSDSPRVAVSPDSEVDPGIDMFYFAQIEGSWNGGAWRPVPMWFYFSEGGRVIGDAALDEFVPPNELTPNPHKLDLRATFHLLDPEDRSSQKLMETSGLPRHGSAIRSRRPDWWPDVERLSALRRFSRSLGSFTVHLYDEYPADFPAQVSVSELGAPLESWFRPDRVRLVRWTPPEGSGSKMKWSHDGTTHTIEGEKRAEQFGLVCCVELLGRFDDDLPVPVAAEASIRIGERSDPLLVFPLMFPKGVRFSRRTGFQSRIVAERNAQQAVTALIKDGIMGGQLHLTPSRSLALETRRFDRYVGYEATLPIEVEVVTVEGVWVNADGP